MSRHCKGQDDVAYWDNRRRIVALTRANGCRRDLGGGMKGKREAEEVTMRIRLAKLKEPLPDVRE